MTPLKWLLLTVGAAAAIVYTLWWYRGHEEPVAGRLWAAALRSTALLLAWLILLNPSWPAALRPGDVRTVALLDASYSMSQPTGLEAPAAWDVGRDSVARFDGVWLFGGSEPRFIDIDSLPAQPIYAESRLVPALRAAALADAGRVIVFTDGAVSDAAEAAEEAERLGLEVSVVTLTPSVSGVGIADISAPRWVQAGDTVRVRAEIVAASARRDSVRVEVVGDAGRVQASAWVAAPALDRFSAVGLAFSVSGGAGGGYRRYAVRIAGAPDLEPRDQERSFYVRVTDRPAGPVLLSLLPDWEPSFLIPNLDRLTDAPTTAYFLISDSLVRLDDYRKVSLAAALRKARAAPLLILHGYGANAPQWARDLARGARRLVVLAAGSRPFELPGWGVRVGAPAQGEWYASSDLPSSPLALELEGFPAHDLAPLVRVRTLEASRRWTPLHVQRLRRGPPVAALVAGISGSRRWVVAVGEGYWRWAFRRAGRQLYRTLWTGLGGWLMEGRPSTEGGLEPPERVVARGEPLRWTVPLDADSLSITVRSLDASIVRSWTGLAGDSLALSLPPGRYRYDARAYEGGVVVARATGPAEVEEFSREFLPRANPALQARLGAGAERPRASRGGQRHLATLGWPYLVLIALFCAEWAVRRYIGLR